eukprot:TRINITY_DN16145_c0_g1_i2.p1 TRINITY_DN16145_c0_g1~~TRINITY_DN16145_c0_g1_i2.p1  ORF type:complete len:417 (-),score=75.36 TRINITY_DN16145_c0_g1_i2:95-1345(-)
MTTMMRGLDRSLKPSMTCYDFRSNLNPRGPGCVPQREVANGNWEALLAAVSDLISIADIKLSGGEDPRLSITVLQRAYRLVRGAMAQAEEEVPEAYLALARVHLHFCVIFSRIGRHHAALKEACAATRAANEIWSLIMAAMLKVDEAKAAQDPLKLPSLHFQQMLKNAPVWLEQAVEVYASSRQAVATEGEIIESDKEVYEFRFRGLYRRHLSGATDLGKEYEGLGSVLERPEDTDELTEHFTWASDRQRLHEEAVLLAEAILPLGNATRQRIEFVARAAAERRQLAGEPSRPREDASGSTASTSGEQQALPPLLRLRSRVRLQPPASPVKSASAPGLAAQGSSGTSSSGSSLPTTPSCSGSDLPSLAPSDFVGFAQQPEQPKPDGAVSQLPYAWQQLPKRGASRGKAASPLLRQI